METRKNLTQYEHTAINNYYNLADGHAHNTDLPQNLLEKLPDIYLSSQNLKQDDVEQRFLKSFFKLANQRAAENLLKNTLLCYSASTAIEIVANFLHKRGFRTALLEPTFDNIPAILVRLGVELVSISEKDFIESQEFSRLLEADAIFLVLPNNPTGGQLSSDLFKDLAYFCNQNNKLLIVDFSFRFFEAFENWDQYAIATQSGCDFIFIEDTGKTWPTLDLKTGIIVSSTPCFDELSIIHNDFLLNVSPFTLLLLDEYLQYSALCGLEETVRSIVSLNRAFLREKIVGTHLSLINPNSRLSVEWLFSSKLAADKIIGVLEENRIYVLPGTNFFWKNPEFGKQFIRIALMRDHGMFCECVDKIVKLIG